MRRRAGAALSVAPGHHDRAVRRGRADRRARAHRGGAHAHRRSGKRCWSRTSPARRARSGSAASRARRRTATRWCSATGRRSWWRARPTRPALRRDEGLRADRAASEQSLHRRQQEGPAGEGLEGADRLHQGEPGQAVRRHRRRRIRPACQRRLFPEGDRHQLHVRAVSRRLRRRDARPDRRAHRSVVRSGDQRAAVRAQRTGARLCDHRQDAACLRARHPDGGRGRRARRLHLHLVRAVGAEGHAGRGGRASSAPPRWRRWPIRRCRSA